MNKTPEDNIKDDVAKILAEQTEIAEQEAKLMAIPEVASVLQAQKRFNENIGIYWEAIFQQMLKHNIKTIKGDWGSVTVAHKQGFDIDIEELPRTYIKRVPDTKKIGETYKLTGKAVKGTTPKDIKYLTKRIK